MIWQNTFHPKNAQWEAIMKYANLHSEYASNLAMIKALKWHMDACDISDPRNNKGFVIPDLVCPILAYLVEDCWCKR